MWDAVETGRTERSLNSVWPTIILSLMSSIIWGWICSYVGAENPSLVSYFHLRTVLNVYIITSNKILWSYSTFWSTLLAFWLAQVRHLNSYALFKQSKKNFGHTSSDIVHDICRVMFDKWLHQDISVCVHDPYSKIISIVSSKWQIRYILCQTHGIS